MYTALALISLAVFAALTIAVTTSESLTLDSRAFETAHDLRSPWLDHVARIVTTMGLSAIIGPAILISGVLLVRRGHRGRGTALVVGAALTWIVVWVVKAVVARPRPPAPLVHTTGESYPSAHAASSVGWLAITIALAVVIPDRNGRIAAVAAGLLLAVLVGLSRIYLRAHYASDVLAGEAVAVAMYGLAATVMLARRSGQSRRQRVVAMDGT